MKKWICALILLVCISAVTASAGASTLYRITTDYPSNEVEGISLTEFTVTAEDATIYDLAIGDTLTVTSTFQNTLPPSKTSVITLTEQMGSYFIVDYMPSIGQVQPLSMSGGGTALHSGESFTNSMDYIVESDGCLSIFPMLSTDKGSVTTDDLSGIPAAYLKVNDPTKPAPTQTQPPATPAPPKQTPVPTTVTAPSTPVQTVVSTSAPNPAETIETAVSTAAPTEMPTHALVTTATETAPNGTVSPDAGQTEDSPVLIWVIVILAVIATAAVTYAVMVHRQQNEK